MNISFVVTKYTNWIGVLEQWNTCAYKQINYYYLISAFDCLLFFFQGTLENMLIYHQYKIGAIYVPSTVNTNHTQKFANLHKMENNFQAVN